MGKKLTIKELAEFINGRGFAQDDNNGVFLAMVCDGEVYGSICGNGEGILKAMSAMIADRPDLIVLLTDAIAKGMYDKGLADAKKQDTKVFEA